MLYVGDEKTYQAGIYATIDARTLRRARRLLPQLSTAVGTLPAQGWYPDPAQRFYRRWWDGHSWTDHVFNDKHTLIDPLG